TITTIGAGAGTGRQAVSAGGSGGAAQAGDASTPGGTAGQIGGAAAGAGSGGAAGTAASPGTNGASGTRSGAGSAAPAPTAGALSTPTCPTPVKLGITISSDEGQALAAFGAGPNAAQDAQLLTAYSKYATETNQTMADWINSHGGLGPNCKLVIGVHDFKTLGA